MIKAIDYHFVGAGKMITPQYRVISVCGRAQTDQKVKKNVKSAAVTRLVSTNINRWRKSERNILIEPRESRDIIPLWYNEF